MKQIEFKNFYLPPLCWVAIAVLLILFWDTILTITLASLAVWILYCHRRRISSVGLALWDKIKAFTTKHEVE